MPETHREAALRIARAWDAHAGRSFVDNNLVEAISQRLKQKTAGLHPREIINIATGYQQYVPSVATDISRMMLAGNPSGMKVIADAQELPFRRRAFRSAVCVFGTNYFPDLQKAVDEMARVTTGRVIIVGVRTGDPKTEIRTFDPREIAGAMTRAGLHPRIEAVPYFGSDYVAHLVEGLRRKPPEQPQHRRSVFEITPETLGIRDYPVVHISVRDNGEKATRLAVLAGYREQHIHRAAELIRKQRLYGLTPGKIHERLGELRVMWSQIPNFPTYDPPV